MTGEVELLKVAEQFAKESTPSYLQLPFDEVKRMQFFLTNLGFNEANIEAEMIKEREELLSSETGRQFDVLKNRDSQVREIFKRYFVAEWEKPVYQADWKRGNEKVWRGTENKPVRWSATLKDPHPSSKLKFRLENWLEEVKWYRHWAEEEIAIVSNLTKEFDGVSTLAGYEYDPDLRHEFAARITIRRR